MKVVQFVVEFAAMLSGRDPEFVRHHYGLHRRFRLVAELVAFVALMCWLFIQLIDVLGTPLRAALAMLLIGAMDVIVGRAMTHDTGWPPAVWPRLLIALVVSTSLALSFLLDENRDRLDAHARMRRAEAMKPLLDRYDALTERDRQEILSAPLQHREDTGALLAAARARLADAERTRADLLIDIADARKEAIAQEFGEGVRLLNCGPLCKAKRAHAAAGEARLPHMDADIARLRAEVEQVSTRAATADEEVEAARRALDARGADRSAQMSTEPTFIPLPSDEFAQRLESLLDLLRGPGALALKIGFGTQMFLFLLLDLSYLLMRMIVLPGERRIWELEALTESECMAAQVLARLPPPPAPPDPPLQRPRLLIRALTEPANDGPAPAMGG